MNRQLQGLAATIEAQPHVDRRFAVRVGNPGELDQQPKEPVVHPLWLEVLNQIGED
ncbi:hypothetical protein [Mesorhizobium captivum]|uniref:hypothetical protein n=1 Tax=Mesorhizobium captivum TaxID=3072319 RepID=UPI002A247B62|nr:hypothetical protein [Mesorhizobium sp. VK3C]MDX8450315.1 hypothetical protein [Mesorhizobium sp. VK3C]